jgi:hypothetical protein
LAVATACLNLLALADTVYTMILLRRYIAHGFDGTLVLLTLGVLVALALQWLLTSVRRVLAQGLGRERDRALAAESSRPWPEPRFARCMPCRARMSLRRRRIWARSAPRATPRPWARCSTRPLPCCSRRRSFS